MKVTLSNDERSDLRRTGKFRPETSEFDGEGKFALFFDVGDRILTEKDGAVSLNAGRLELAADILERKPELTVLFFTDNDDEIAAFELQVRDYAVRPIEKERVIRAIRQIRSARSERGGLMSEMRPIRLNLFRQVLIGTAGNRFAPLQWRTTKARELFLYLLQHRGQPVQKSMLIDLLWPEYECGKVQQLLYTAVYHVRKTLKPFGKHFQIKSTTDGYILKLNHVVLDVEEWENRLNSGLPINNETIAAYRELMEMYTGDYLQEYDYWWAEGKRHQLKLKWLRTAFRMAEWYMAGNRTNEAVEMYLEICDRHPQAEEAHFMLMQIYAAEGNHLSVNRQYRLLTAFLLEELNEAPSPYITQWYNNWKMENG